MDTVDLTEGLSLLLLDFVDTMDIVLRHGQLEPASIGLRIKLAPEFPLGLSSSPLSNC